MADDWIGKPAKEAKTHDRELLTHERHRAHKAQVIAEKNQRLWEEPLATVERDVRRFQQEFAQDPKRSLALEKIPPSGFRVHRPDLPTVVLDVRLQSSGAEIAFRYDSISGLEQANRDGPARL